MLQIGLEIIAFLLLIASVMLADFSIIYGSMALVAAFGVARFYSFDYAEGLELIVFYGAVAACVIAVFGWL